MTFLLYNFKINIRVPVSVLPEQTYCTMILPDIRFDYSDIALTGILWHTHYAALRNVPARLQPSKKIFLFGSTLNNCDWHKREFWVDRFVVRCEIVQFWKARTLFEAKCSSNSKQQSKSTAKKQQALKTNHFFGQFAEIVTDLHLKYLYESFFDVVDADVGKIPERKNAANHLRLWIHDWLINRQNS